MGKRQAVTVALKPGVPGRPPKTVEGFVSCNALLAVTPAHGTRWNVTHIPTGALIAHNFSQRAAFKVAGALSGLFDWEGDEVALLPRYRALPVELVIWWGNILK